MLGAQGARSPLAARAANATDATKASNHDVQAVLMLADSTPGRSTPSADVEPANWPSLRADLQWYEAQADAHGAPVWTLHDPSRHRFFQLDWMAYALVQALPAGSVAAVCAQVAATSVLRPQAEQVASLLQFLTQHELCGVTQAADTERLIERRASQDRSWWQVLIHGYLFFRTPLVNPDAALSRLLPHVKCLFGRGFWWSTLAAGVIGLLLAWQQWPLFAETAVDTLSWNGLLAYGVTLVALKVCHELGHALTAKRYGCHVPSMGVAWLVMWPVAYTDVTDSWKLPQHRQRLAIAAAGIATELALAAWALLLWNLLPNGVLRGTCYFVATVSLLATLAINASPFMRFDGYFLLCDLTGTPNLHERCFAMARWWLRRYLLGWRDPMPELVSTPRWLMMVAMAFATAIYRLVVFTGIAIMVYHLFFKVLGLVLFAIEIYYFLARPIVVELRAWWQRAAARPDDRQALARWRERPAAWLVLGLGAAVVLPLDFSVNGQGVLKPERRHNVVTELSARLEVPLPAPGTRWTQGASMVQLRSDELDYQVAQNQLRRQTLLQQLAQVSEAPNVRAEQAVAREELRAVSERGAGLREQQARLQVLAPFDATVVEVTPQLHVGDVLPARTPLLTLADTGPWWVEAVIEESDLDRIAVGTTGRFVPEAPGLATLDLEVIEIEPQALTQLSDAVLASSAGGQILAQIDNKTQTWKPLRAVYRVRLRVLGTPLDGPPMQRRGSVILRGWPRSVLGDLVRGAASLVIRESGF